MTLWYLTRGAGAVSLVLLTSTILLGIGTWTRWATTRWPRRFGTGLHRNISMLSLVFVVLHVVTSVIDGYVPLTLLDAVVPFGAGYRPVWVGLGAVAFDLLLALIITSLLQRRMGWKRWRATHWAAYACWPIAVLHGVKTGSDSGSAWFTVLVLACVAAVAGSVLARIATARSRTPKRPVPASARKAPLQRDDARVGGQQVPAGEAAVERRAEEEPVHGPPRGGIGIEHDVRARTRRREAGTERRQQVRG